MLPVLMLVFGLIQYGLYFWAMQGGSDIARSAARLAAVGKPADCAAFRADIRSQVNDLTGSGSTATVTRSYVRTKPPAVSIGDTVTVQVSFKSVDLHFPFVPFIKDGTVTAKAKARVDFVPAPPETCG
ncbi:MAG: pilus assembly protein [Nocardioidaceae bacterium]|nr:pilus assembly protein [Nocardioidaceae bacterium]